MNARRTSFRCSRWARPGWVVALALLSAAGCTYGISVRPTQGPELLRAWRASVAEVDGLSPRTLQTLHRWDLESQFKKRPAETYQYLHNEVATNPDPELLFALAEISYHFGRKAEKNDCDHACGYYYRCAGYAYHYLFSSPAGQPVTLGPGADEFGQLRHFDSFAFDPRFRLACDLYNTGLSKCIAAAQRVGKLDPRQQLHVPTRDGKGFTLSVVHHGFPWRPEEFGPLLRCGDYEVVGLANHYRGYGLGVALIGIRDPEMQARDQVGDWADRHVRAYRPEPVVADPSSRPEPADPAAGPRRAGRFPREVSFPVTAFFRFEGGVADLDTQRSGRLELYNPLTIQTVSVNNHEVPLETDLTTPLAYFLSRTDLDGIEYKAFLSADKIQDRTGTYMFEPYQPGKIPVVMIHGMLGSPVTWTTMFNDLRADPELRKHYQFWFYLYPTGNPYLATAADLRQELDRLRAEFDPTGNDPALDHVVLVGHSMGGLVGRLMATDSGDDFWRLVSNRSLDYLQVSTATRGELRRMFYFGRENCVERVVFLATPHHGSKLSPSPPVRLAAKFIRLPRRLIETAGDLAVAEPGAKGTQFANSIDLLGPHAPALELLAAKPVPPRVHFHSIIGDAFGEGEKSSDGVVPYWSSHVEAVDSELMVPAYHMAIHHHPRAVIEVRRILLEHLSEVQREDGVIHIPTSPVPPRPVPAAP